jgi:hypothetical protein
MKSAAQKITSTQKFIDIIDVVEDIVILNGGNACLIIEVKATNFALLSKDEQDAKLFAYAALLNSLSFAIQIVIRSKKLDISSYLSSLAAEQAKTQNPSLARQIGLYRDFVKDLVKVNTILDKQFYIIIPYSSLEKGLSGVGQSNFFIGAKTALHSKAEGLHTQLRRLNLKAETLGKENIIKLFHDIFNDGALEMHQQTAPIVKPLILGKETK